MKWLTLVCFILAVINVIIGLTLKEDVLGWVSASLGWGLVVLLEHKYE